MVLYIAAGDYMILYRNMKYDEYNKILDAKEFPIYDERKFNIDNSFTYEDGNARMHLFGNIEYAKMYLDIFGEMIVKCNIPDNLIEKYGYGFYEFKSIPVYVPIPEYIIKRSDFSLDYIEEINPSIRKNANFILGIREVKLYDMFLNDMYLQWKKNNNGNKNENNFCYYVINYLKTRNLDDVLTLTAGKHLEKTGKIKAKKR